MFGNNIKVIQLRQKGNTLLKRTSIRRISPICKMTTTQLKIIKTLQSIKLIVPFLKIKLSNPTVALLTTNQGK